MSFKTSSWNKLYGLKTEKFGDFILYSSWAFGYVCIVLLNHDSAIYSLNDKPLKLVNHFGSNILSTENNVNVHISNVWQ